MWKQASLLALAVALSACSGSSPNPVNGSPEPENPVEPPVEPPTEPDVIVPEALARNLGSVTYVEGDPDDPLDDVILVEDIPQDASPIQTTYTRNAALDVDGYRAYSVQDDRLDRIYIAVGAENEDGMSATAVSDAGQFNRFFSGVNFTRTGSFVPPDVGEGNGQVEYVGLYAGITNEDAIINDQRLPLEPGDPATARPYQGRQTVGKVFLNVDFADNRVNGTIYDRKFTDGKELPSVDLIDAGIDDNGNFSGEVEFSGRPDQGAQGDYAGVFGGDKASSVAGGISLNNIYDPEALDPDDDEFDAEVGVFLLPRCGTEGAPDICSGLGSDDD